MLNVGGANPNNAPYFVFYAYGATKTSFRTYLVVTSSSSWVKGTGPGILFIICATPTTWRKVILLKEDALGGIFPWYTVAASYKTIYFVIVDFLLVKSGRFWIPYFDKFAM